MPRTTAGYGFEFELLHWACALTKEMTGEIRGMLLILDTDGAVRKAFFGECRLHIDLAMAQALMRSSESWLLFHPFDLPEYSYLAWQNVQRATVERLMRRRFDEAAFRPFTGPPLSEGTELAEFPVSWTVTF